MAFLHHLAVVLWATLCATEAKQVTTNETKLLNRSKQSFTIHQACEAVRAGDLQRLAAVLETDLVLKDLNLRQCMGRWVRKSLLHEAVLRGNVLAVKMLIDKGARVDVQDGDGWTPLALAAGHGFLPTARVLLENFADIDYRNNHGRTALMEASQQGTSTTCEWLVDNGASTSKKDMDGNTAMLLAAKEGHVQLVRWFLSRSRGVLIDAADNEGWTALVWAVKRGHPEMVTALLSFGASVNLPDLQGNRPLLWALKAGNLRMTELLVNHGADVYQITSDLLPPYLASGDVAVNDFMLRSRWKAFFLNPAVALSLLLGVLVGVATTFLQLQPQLNPMLSHWTGPAYDLINQAISKEVMKDETSTPPASFREQSEAASDASGLHPNDHINEDQKQNRWRDYVWPQFYHGAVLQTAGRRTSLLLCGQIVEIEATAVMFCFGLVVVRWIVWIPLHALLFVPQSVQHWTFKTLISEPALLVAKLPKIPGFLLMLRCGVLWTLLFLAARPENCKLPSYCTWAHVLCDNGSVSLTWLTLPGWSQLLMKQLTWKREGVSGITGCYLLMLGVGFLGYLISLVEQTYHHKKRLSVEVHQLLAASQTCAAPASRSVSVSRSASDAGGPTSKLRDFQRQLRIQLLLLLVDTILHVNTVFVFLWTGHFVVAFLLLVVVSRSISFHFVAGRFQTFREAILESERFGMIRKDLVHVFAQQRGFQAFFGLCLTSYSYWYCVENAYHAFMLLSSMILSTHSVAEHLHQRVDFEMDVQRTPPPADLKVLSAFARISI